MSLGVLNNLTAMYAENNLNNTTTSLSKVLNQLSSGSKINSGADDAAGLSLVDGLQANSVALAQSQTNAQEGVGLLQVADGALSQVTSLLNRAVTLATEASNGTLNSTQDLAANQEYQSILSEINNIGTTTSYNQQQVFNSQTSIYTGDSSSLGASVNELNIRSLSSANLGDTAGVMSYSNGQSNVFMNLSSASTNAAVTDSLNASGSTTISVSYLTNGANGATVSANANISVGSGTSYANTAQGLISAINDSGLGLNATFATAAQAGSSAVAAAAAAGGAASNTGIQISATGIGANGAGTNGVGVVGTLSMASGDTLGGTLNIVGSDGASHNINLGTAHSTDNLVNLASTINTAAYGVTASVNQAGTQLTFTTANSQVSVTGTNLTQSTAATAPQNIAITGTGLGSLTVGSASDTLTGTLNITEGADVHGTVSNLTLGTQGSTDTLANLASTINNGGYGVTATLNQAGTVLSFTKSNGDAGTAAVSGSSIQDVAAPGISVGTTLGSLSLASASDTIGTGTLDINSGITGKASVLAMGTAGSTDTLANLAATINSGGYGITASLDKTGTDLTFTANAGNPYTAAIASAGNIQDGTYTTAAATFTAGAPLETISLSGVNDTLSDSAGAGNIVIVSSAGTDTIAMGAGVSLATLASDINALQGGGHANLTATVNQAGTELTLTGTAGNGATLTSVTDSGGGHFQDNIAAVANTTSITAQSGTLGTLSVLSANNLVSGTLNITSGTSTSGGAISLIAAGQTLAQIAADFNSTAVGGTGTAQVTGGGTALNNLGITATLNAAGTELTFTQSSGAANNVHTAAISSSGALGNLAETPVISTGATLGSLTATNASDTLSGTFNVVEGADKLGTGSSLNFSGQTLAQIAADFNTATGTNNWSGYGITANLSGTQLTFTQSASDAGTASITSSGIIGDTTAAVTNNPTISVASNVLTAASANDTLTGTLQVTNASGVTTGYNLNGYTLTQIENSFNSPGGANNGSGITASLSGNAITFTTGGQEAISGVGITDYTPASTVNRAVATGTILNTLTVANSTDTLSNAGVEKLTITNGTSGATSNVTITQGQTLQEIAQDFNSSTNAAGLGIYQNLSTYGITATLNTAAVVGADGVSHAAGTVLTFTQTASDGYEANIVSDAANPLTDQTAAATTANASTNGSMAAGTGNANTITIGTAGDTLTGTLKITEGADLHATTSTLNLAGQTLAQIQADFNTTTGTVNLSNLGITAVMSANNKSLTFVANGGEPGAANANVQAVTALVDQTGPVNANVTTASGTMLDTLSVNSSSDILGGTLTLTSGLTGAAAPAITLGTAGTTDTLANLASTINAGNYGITATLNAAKTELTFSQNSGDGFAAKVAGTTISDTMGTSLASSTNLGTLTVNNTTDQLTGTLTGIEGNGTTPFTLNLNGQTLAQVASMLNTTDVAYGITATLNQAGTSLSFTPTSGDASTPTIGNQGYVSDVTPAGVTAINLTNQPSASEGYYSLGISGSVADTSTTGGTANVGIATDQNGSGGTATITYSDSAGQSLSSSKLDSQANARLALTELNAAISDVAAQDGYIGAQINTLNAVSSVLSTQQQNVVSAQNAVQATDYASATSNMSKYEILSQTGIAALAQANSMSQEVTKLLQ